MTNIVYVSVNQSFVTGMTADELAEHAHAAWPLSLAKGSETEVLVAVIGGQPLMAWKVLGAYVTDDTYETNGGSRPRIAFALGSPIPIDPAWHEVPALRRGVATAER